MGTMVPMGFKKISLNLNGSHPHVLQPCSECDAVLYSCVWHQIIIIGGEKRVKKQRFTKSSRKAPMAC